MKKEKNSEDLIGMCRRLRLGAAIPEMLPERSEPERAVIGLMLKAISDQRYRNMLLKRFKKSGLRSDQTLDGYEWGRFRFPAAYGRDDLISLDFIRKHENVILYGPPGTGKTRLANGLGLLAIESNFKAKFITTADLVGELLAAHAQNDGGRYMRDLTRLDVLILDEWGYVPIEQAGTRLLFSVIDKFYEQRSIIMITNFALHEWQQRFSDHQITAAIADRMCHHSHLLYMDGRSFRLENSQIVIDDPSS